MALSDTQVRKAVAGEKNYKLSDSLGLFLLVTTTGFKSWRFKYRFAGKEKLQTIGGYPDVSLAAARAVRDRSRAELREHKDPITEDRKREMAAHAAAGATFKSVALLWHEAQLGRWSPVQATKVRQALERDVYPAFGKMPIADVTSSMVLTMLRKIEARGAIDSAKRIRQHVSAVFAFAIPDGLCAGDPAGKFLVKSLKPTPVGGSQPGLDDVQAIRAMHAKIDRCSSGPLARLASRLLALTYVRPGTVPTARWEEFEGIDWDDTTGAGDAALPIWRISADRMKLQLTKKSEAAFEHIAPLPPQAVDVLRAVRRISGRHPYLFTSLRSTHEPMSVNTIGYMYNNNGYRGRHVPHGWRTSFSTIMNEWAAAAGRREELQPIIDLMLSHVPKGMSASELDYNRAKYMPVRWEIARAWADWTMEGLPPASSLIDGYVRAG